MIRVLLVEDDAEFRANMGLWLTRSGFAVCTAEDGAEALGHFRRQAFDVVVTDMCMPRMDGLTLLDAIATERPALQVVFLTGQASLETAIAALREGRAFDFVLKPLRDLSAFRSTLERAAIRTQEKSAAAKWVDHGASDLPERDLAILTLLGQGLENRAIADRLSLSERTVRNRLSALYERLGVANRTQVVLWAQERGLI